MRFSADSRVVEQWPHYTVAIPKEWRAERGVWVIHISAVTPWRQQSALVVVTQEGVNRRATLLKDVITPDDIEGQLRNMAKGAVELGSE